jgi:hypothetical protein
VSLVQTVSLVVLVCVDRELLVFVCAVCRHSSDPLKADEQMRFICELWRRRLSGVQRNVEVRRAADCLEIFLPLFTQ